VNQPVTPSVVVIARHTVSAVASMLQDMTMSVIEDLLLAAVPATGVKSPARRTIAGFNVLDWSDSGVHYWAVSDLGASDLDSFAKAFREAEPD